MSLLEQKTLSSSFLDIPSCIHRSLILKRRKMAAHMELKGEKTERAKKQNLLPRNDSSISIQD